MNRQIILIFSIRLVKICRQVNIHVHLQLTESTHPKLTTSKFFPPEKFTQTILFKRTKWSIGLTTLIPTLSNLLLSNIKKSNLLKDCLQSILKTLFSDRTVQMNKEQHKVKYWVTAILSQVLLLLHKRPLVSLRPF